ncbi:MAG: DUF4870 domain-containing protein [Proteobacteria bacterium]|nr:DUF4870 domain-containing protein [Pseudomonadota bacterium]
MSTPDPASPDPPSSPSSSVVPAVAPASSLPSVEERQWAMLAHLSALLGYLITSGWAGSAGGFLGPLIVWSLKKDTLPFVDQQGKEALNFSITICIAFAVLFAFGVMTFFIGFIIAIPLMLAIALYALVFTIIASIKANEGVAYRYPITLRLIK